MTESSLFEIDAKIKSGELVECPHCNGYGSSLKEASPRCTCCDGKGVVNPDVPSLCDDCWCFQKSCHPEGSLITKIGEKVIFCSQHIPADIEDIEQTGD